jgi:hypothetical protein
MELELAIMMLHKGTSAYPWNVYIVFCLFALEISIQHLYPSSVTQSHLQQDALFRHANLDLK